MPSAAPRAVIFGLAGPVLEEAERRFFGACDPLGFILFARNCREPAQVRVLVEDLRESVRRPDALVLIDQEGGRVQRLGPPFWRAAPPPAAFGALCVQDETAALEAAWLNARLLADDLHAVGVSVDCAPVLDLRHPRGHDIIGDRAFASDAATVALLGRATCAGLLAGGVLPVIKHVPGHGRATCDSHVSLPLVDASLAELQETDLAPFASLADMPIAMTAHVVYAALDQSAPATTSAIVVRDLIRNLIGFEGLLLSDDLCMRALSGSPAHRAQAALSAGCDVVLHCNGVLDEMRAVADACPQLGGTARMRLERAREMLVAPMAFDAVTARSRLAELLSAAAVA